MNIEEQIYEEPSTILDIILYELLKKAKVSADRIGFETGAGKQIHQYRNGSRQKTYGETVRIIIAVELYARQYGIASEVSTPLAVMARQSGCYLIKRPDVQNIETPAMADTFAELASELGSIMSEASNADSDGIISQDEADSVHQKIELMVQMLTGFDNHIQQRANQDSGREVKA